MRAIFMSLACTTHESVLVRDRVFLFLFRQRNGEASMLGAKRSRGSEFVSNVCACIDSVFLSEKLAESLNVSRFQVYT